jgi:hypothetical protein
MRTDSCLSRDVSKDKVPLVTMVALDTPLWHALVFEQPHPIVLLTDGSASVAHIWAVACGSLRGPMPTMPRGIASSTDEHCKFLIYSESRICAIAARDSLRILVMRAVIMAQQYKTRRSTTTSLGVALSRAIVIPVEIPLITTGVLGHCMHVDITTLASMAEAALALQRDCASFNDIDD